MADKKYAVGKHPNSVKNLKPMKPGETRNPNGRPRKYLCALKDQGYRLSEIHDTFKVLLSMNIEELKAVMMNDKATILEVIVASSMIKSIRSGQLMSLETVITRIYGQPKANIEQSGKQIIEIVRVSNKDASRAE